MPCTPRQPGRRTSIQARKCLSPETEASRSRGDTKAFEAVQTAVNDNKSKIKGISLERWPEYFALHID